MALDSSRVIYINPDEYNNIYVVGDIHGEINLLNEIILKTRPRDNDLMIFLGDYVDRGPDSYGCIRTVYELRQRHPDNYIALMGNHENMLVDLYNERYISRIWREYEEAGIKSKMRDHMGYSDALKTLILIKWAKNLPVLVNIGDKIYASHAGYDFRKDKDLNKPLNEVLEGLLFDDFLWNRAEFYNDYCRPEKWYIGHTMVPCIKSGYVFPWIRKNNITMMDTAACVRKGRLSCIEVKTGRIYQSTSNQTSPYEGW